MVIFCPINQLYKVCLTCYIKIYVTREYFHFLFHLSYRLLIPRELLYFQVSKFVFRMQKSQRSGKQNPQEKP